MFRGKQLETSPVPEFLAEKISIAAGHFLFIVNEVEWKANDKPNIEISGGTNHVILTLPVIRKDALALSTDDRGITETEEDVVITRKIDPLDSTATFVQPAGYLMHVFICGHATGSVADYTFKAGYSSGSNDIISDFAGVVPLSGGNIPIPVHQQKVFDTDQTIYVEKTSGAGAKGKIWVQLIKNS